MKIAVASEKGNVSGHFGHCEGFYIFEVENEEVKDTEFVENPGYKPGFLPNFLNDKGINVIISGGMVLLIFSDVQALTVRRAVVGSLIVP